MPHGIPAHAGLSFACAAFPRVGRRRLLCRITCRVGYCGAFGYHAGWDVFRSDSAFTDSAAGTLSTCQVSGGTAGASGADRMRRMLHVACFILYASYVECCMLHALLVARCIILVATAASAQAPMRSSPRQLPKCAPRTVESPLPLACRVCAPPTSAPGLGPPRHICAGTGPTPVARVLSPERRLRRRACTRGTTRLGA